MNHLALALCNTQKGFAPNLGHAKKTGRHPLHISQDITLAGYVTTFFFFFFTIVVTDTQEQQQLKDSLSVLIINNEIKHRFSVEMF